MTPPHAQPASGFTLVGSSFSRSYGGNLPSSLTTVLPIALVLSTCPPVSVWGTGAVPTHCWDFLGSMGSVTSPEADRHHVSGLMAPTLIGTPLHAYPGNYHRPGSPTLLRPPSVTRHQRGQNRPKTASDVADFGLGADTAVPEYQPVVHRLRLSASP